jgi:hypothetical protein
MTTRTCLRCDWQGTTDEKRCPNCAAPLYAWGEPPSEGTEGAVRGHPEERSRAAASTGIVAPSAPTSRPPSPPSPHEAEEPRTTRSRSLVALVLTVIVLAVAVGSWLNAHTEPAASPAARNQVIPTGLTGTLVYAVPDGPDRSRLWRWDLATGRVVRGPRVPRAIELVDARGASPGWIGVTSELPDGRLRASVLRFLGPDDRATPILEGDMVSWGPQGATVIAGRRGPLRHGCRRSVSIVWAKLVPELREREYADPSLCGDLLSIGQDSASTMFTLDRDGQIGVFFAGGDVGTIHPVLPGYAMVAVSALSDIIVVPREALASLAPLPARSDQEHADLQGAGLHFLGSGEPRPLRYGVGSDSFAIARMLAWNASAASALVVGRQGFRRGFYLLDTASGDGVGDPRYIGPVSGIPYGTFAFDDTVFVETTDGLFATIGEDLVPLRRPTDAPAPDGPIVWIR